MTTYENAPATQLLATHCAVCTRPLLDSLSCEIGMGPDCRKKHGYDDVSLSDFDRKEANRVINAIARHRATGPNSVLVLISVLQDMNFHKLASILLKRVTTVEIARNDNRVIVKSPYNPAWIDASRTIPGRRWEPATKTFSFPENWGATVLRTLVECYPGQIATGAKGPFVLAKK